ncbi:MAG: Proline iminopeptidase [Candidatus Gottesmanbacteria bacterium GW2011_GWA1_43_11]|uniref:Proline iminopeptidase n=1 Tax=Candidatus Gottesmanbacteria bacterium GW2011_GWA1_43_11 TaxID=1618436 RepID=A0A0G1CCY7_9BACT|nr:MAG: Proline iminopeptidase [Candidatus Gottesmanbacteria bacterium GW2011_GWA1_43_11]
MAERPDREHIDREGFIPVEGGKVWYRMSGLDDQTPLIFLHGGPGFPPYNFSCLEALGDRRPVVFYHQLGCGKSERPSNPELWNLDRFVDELKTVKDTLGLDRVHLMGHSWGGSLAVEYALNFPEGVESLILASPLLSTPRWIDDANRLKRTLPEEAQTVIEESERSGKTDSEEYKAAIQEFYSRYWCRLETLPDSAKRTSQEANMDVYTTMWGPSEFYCTGNLKTFDGADRLQDLRMPVLFTCGRYDEATVETVSDFQKGVGNAQMVVFENSAHHAEIEETEKFVATIAGFVNQVDSKTS